MSANGDLIIVETYVQGKTIENQFLIYGLKCNIYIYIFGYLRALGVFKFLILPPAILSSISMFV